MITSTPDDLDPETASPHREPPSHTPPAWAVELQLAIAERLTGFEITLQDLFQRLNPPVDSERSQPEVLNADGCNVNAATDLVAPIVATPPAPEPVDWMSALLGPILCEDPQLDDSIHWIEQNILEGNLHALSLVGHLLVFRCAPSDRKPSLLKDVGEAYYRCFPKTRDLSNPFEDALIAWLKQHCEAADLRNSIELVHPGERFDAARHSPVERGGVEIAEVLGWVVLRDGGKVFSKASVQTR